MLRSIPINRIGTRLEYEPLSSPSPLSAHRSGSGTNPPLYPPQFNVTAAAAANVVVLIGGRLGGYCGSWMLKCRGIVALSRKFIFIWIIGQQFLQPGDVEVIAFESDRPDFWGRLGRGSTYMAPSRSIGLSLRKVRERSRNITTPVQPAAELCMAQHDISFRRHDAKMKYLRYLTYVVVTEF